MWLKLLFKALLFIAFVPGVLITLPPGGDRWTVLVVHAVLYAIVSMFLWKAMKGRM
jgi:hypothetical protein